MHGTEIAYFTLLGRDHKISPSVLMGLKEAREVWQNTYNIQNNYVLSDFCLLGYNNR
jgi:hypothetical protein